MISCCKIICFSWNRTLNLLLAIIGPSRLRTSMWPSWNSLNLNKLIYQVCLLNRISTETQYLFILSKHIGTMIWIKLCGGRTTDIFCLMCILIIQSNKKSHHEQIICANRPWERLLLFCWVTKTSQDDPSFVLNILDSFNGTTKVNNHSDNSYFSFASSPALAKTGSATWLGKIWPVGLLL